MCRQNAMSMEDSVILNLIKKNDSKAFAQLYDRYWAKVYNFACLYFSSRTDAEEVVQEVFIKIWELREKLETLQNFDGFLFIVTRNIIFSGMRKSFREACLKATVLRALDSEEEIVYDFDGEMDAAELKKYINELVAQLPAQRQQVYRMSREKGLSYKEIAVRCGITEKTVENQISSALRFIRQNLPLFIAFMA